MIEYAQIDLDQDQVIRRTRQALHGLLECWDMEYDHEDREEVRLVAALLDILWAQSPEGLCHAAEMEASEEAMRLHNERVDANRAEEQREMIEKAAQEKAAQEKA